MAVKIPVYQERIGISSRPMPSANADVRMVQDTRLQGIGDTLQRVGGMVQQVDQRAEAERQKREDDDARVWVAQTMPQVYERLEADFGEMSKQAGPGAEGFAKGFSDHSNKVMKEYVDGARTEAQKFRMNLAMAEAHQQYAMKAIKYQQGEKTRYSIETDTENAKRLTGTAYAAPQMTEALLGQYFSGVDANANYSPEQKAVLKEAARKDVWFSGMKGWIDANPASASGALEEAMKTDAERVGGIPFRMAGIDEKMKLAAYAQAKQNEAEAQKFAGAYIAASRSAVDAAPMMAGDMVNLPRAKAAALKQAEAALGAKLDDKQRLDLEGYVERLAGVRERDVKRGREATMAYMFDQLDRNGGDYQTLIANNPSVASMPTDYRMRVSEYAGKVATGQTRPTDWQAYNALVSDPATLKATNLDAIKDRFGAHEFSQLKGMQQKLNEGMPEQNMVSDHALVSQMLDEAGFKNNKKKQATFFSLLQDAVDQERIATGKKDLPQSRIKELASDLLVKEVTSKGVLFDSKDEAFEIEVPPAERAKIEAALVAEGLPVSAYNVLQAYRAKLRNLTK